MKSFYFFFILFISCFYIDAMDKHSPRALKGVAFDLPIFDKESILRFLEKNQISSCYVDIIREVLELEYNPYNHETDDRIKKLMIWEMFFYIRNSRLCRNNTKRIDEEYFYTDPHEIIRRLCKVVDKIKKYNCRRYLRATSKRVRKAHYRELFYIK
jgi:hypothetical protein